MPITETFVKLCSVVIDAPHWRDALVVGCTHQRHRLILLAEVGYPVHRLSTDLHTRGYKSQIFAAKCFADPTFADPTQL